MMPEETILDSEVIAANKEIIDDISLGLSENIKTYSRDWTVETIYNQIEQGNIDLNPKFQRRNAWKDEKRSLLIESLILRLPVPEIVLAESHYEKNKFIVLDGKQRLLTIAGFINHDKYKYWDKPVLKDLKMKPELNNLTYEILKNSDDNEAYRAFQNSDIRCTVVFNQSTDDILYEIFYRLNSGAVPLSMQELRQSLRKGGFSDFLMECTEKIGPVHQVLGISLPDKRLIDAEIVLKFMSNRLRLGEYGGNLKKFLDDTLVLLNKEWMEKMKVVQDLYAQFNSGIENLKATLGGEGIGKYYQETRFNRNLFDVQIYYFSQLTEADLTHINITAFIKSYINISNEHSDFRRTLTSSTNTKKNVAIRYNIFRNIVNDSFQKKFPQILPTE